jgi:hypothetical protein
MSRLTDCYSAVLLGAAIFAVAKFSTYVSESSEWLAYAGIRVGITFLICYAGLALASDVYKPLRRFWGFVLGVLTSGLVFLLFVAGIRQS